MASTRTPGITSVVRRTPLHRQALPRHSLASRRSITQEQATRLQARSSTSTLKSLGVLTPTRCSATARHVIWHSRATNEAWKPFGSTLVLMRHLGSLEPHHIHDATLAPFILSVGPPCERNDDQSTLEWCERS